MVCSEQPARAVLQFRLGQQPLDGADQLAILERLFEMMLDGRQAGRGSILCRADDDSRDILPAVGGRDRRRAVFDMQHDQAGPLFGGETLAGENSRIGAANPVDLEALGLKNGPQNLFRFGKTIDDENALG